MGTFHSKFEQLIHTKRLSDALGPSPLLRYSCSYLRGGVFALRSAPLDRVSRESGMAVDKTMWTERARTLAFGLAVMAALLFGLLLVARPAHAATFTVNSTGDENDLDFPGGISNGSSDGRCY